jgi:GrpB-like predicted nucleotidyltransferase (UPF0157 family)
VSEPKETLSGTDHPEDIARAIGQRVMLSDYDPNWPAQFEAERRHLMQTLPGAFIAIEHIGSTAVPGMRAKPLIDMLAGVSSMDEAFALHAVIEKAGYVTPGSFNESLTTRQWFMRQKDGHRTHHLHVVVHDSDEWRLRVGFRDRLRCDPELRASYEALKQDLARRYADDRDHYTDGKSAFIMGAAQPNPRKEP